jgi:hypothetical protein
MDSNTAPMKLLSIITHIASEKVADRVEIYSGDALVQGSSVLQLYPQTQPYTEPIA